MSPTTTTAAASRRSSSQRRNQLLPSSQQPRRQRRVRSQSPGAVRTQCARPPREGTPTASLAVTSSSSSSSSTSSSSSSSSSSKQKDESTGLEKNSYKRTDRGLSSSRDADGREIGSGNRREGSRRSDERGLGSSIEVKLPINESRDLGGRCEREKSRERGTVEDRGHRKDGGRPSSPRSVVGFGVRNRDQGWRGGDSRNSSNTEVSTSTSCTGSGESGDRQGREWNEKSPGRGRRGAGGNGSGWMEGERGLRRDRGARRSSRERLLPPEAFLHNRDDRKKDSPNVKTVSNSNSPPPKKRARSRERSAESKRLRNTSFEKTPQIQEPEIRPNVNVQKVDEHLIELGKEPSYKGDEKITNDDLSGISIKDNVEAHTNAEEGEEVFSDFGESDEEILTKEGVLDLSNEVLVGSGDTRTSNRPESRTSSQKSATSRSKDNTDVLDISGDLDEVSQGEDEEEEVDETKDALDVDWSELMAKPEGDVDKVEETGVLKKRWSLAAVLNRVGLSESLVGKKKYDEIIALANKDVAGA